MSNDIVLPPFPLIATVTEPILHRDDFWLPESPIHDAETGLTWFTDIPHGVIYSFDVKIGQASLRRIEVGEFVGCLALIEGDPHHLALAAKKGLAKLNIDSGELKYLSTLYPTSEEQTKMRTNDGNVDVKGRFWFGTMTSFGLGPPKTEGTLFRSDPDLSLHVMKHPITVPNGLAFSPDNAYLYFTDTRLSTIFRYTFSSETGAISNEEEFIVFTAEKYGPGSPDGLAISEDGDLWVAIFNGHRVLRIDAQSKEVKGAIEFPSSRQVACPRFVGQGLLVTTGKLVHMDPEVGKGHSPHAGDVFWVPDVGVRGREIYKAKLHQ